MEAIASLPKRLRVTERISAATPQCNATFGAPWQRLNFLPEPHLWQFSPPMARDEILRAAFHLTHELGAWALAALTVSHAAAALLHHFVLRDDVLECMTPVIQRHVPGRNSQLAISFQPETHSGNKSDPLAILLARHSNAP